MTGRVRITAGTLKGRWLKVPKSGVRPTSDRVKEAVFSALGLEVQKARVLDAFAGTGALGLEALSRGAAEVVLVEQHKPTARALAEVIADWGVSGVEVVCAPAEKVVGGRLTGFDLVLADPPYKLVLDDAWWARLAHAVGEGGLLVLERDRATTDAVPAGFALERRREYGQSQVSFLRRAPRVDDA